MTVTLDLIERGLRRGLPEARDLVRTPEAALAVAQRLLQDDPAAVADFNGRADHLAGYLRHVAAHGRVDAAAFEAELSDTEREALWLADWERSQSLRDDFNGDRAAYLAWCRHAPRSERPAVKPATTKATATPAPAPAAAPRAAAPAPVAAPAVALSHSKQQVPTTTSVRLSLAAAGAKLGMPLERLRLTTGVLEALREAGLGPVITAGRTVELDSEAVARLAADRAALERLDVRLAAAVPSLGHVGSGHEISIK